MRFPGRYYCWGKSSSSLTRAGGSITRSPPNALLHGSHPLRRAAAMPRHFAVGQQTHDNVSTTSASGSGAHASLSLSLRHGYKHHCYAGGDVALGNIVRLGRNNNNDDDDRWRLIGRVRAFSSTDANGEGEGVDAGALDDMNQQIISCAESGDIIKSQEVLNQIQSNAISQNNKDGFPDIDSYTALMNATLDEQNRLISASKEDGMGGIMGLAQKAHDLLISMEDISGVSDHYSSMRLSGSSTIPKITITNTTTTKTSNNNPDDNKDLLLRDASLRPTSHHYDSVIMAFANASTCTSHLPGNAPYIAQRWLQRMETLAFDPHSGVAMSVDSYFHVMEACAATGSGNGTAVSSRLSTSTPILVQSIFDKLKANTNIRPTVRECRLMLRAWCSKNSAGVGHKEAAYRAMGVWMEMQREFRGGDEEMETTLEDGKMVLEAWTSSVNKHSARRAQTVLTTMQDLHTNKKTTVQPDLDCYRYALITMSRSRAPTSVGLNIPNLFKSMEDSGIFPDTECFDCAIETLKNCAVRSKEEEDTTKYAKAAENMLERMEKERDRSSVKVIRPSARTYTNAILALASRGMKSSAEKAHEFLKKMEEESELGDESMRPTRDSYVGTIQAYGHSGMEDNFVHANEILQRMIAQHSDGNDAARPDIFAFHAVIKACAKAADNTSSTVKRKEALLVAISTVQLMKKSDCSKHHPNAATYHLLLNCAKSLLPSGTPEAEKALRSIFRSCIRDGLVSQHVLKEFQSSVSMEVYHREVVRDAPSYNGIKSLPETWTRGLGYSVRTHDYTEDTEHTEEGMVVRKKRNPIISVSGEVIASTAYNDHRMRRRWEKKNQKLLQGGRM